MPYLYYTGNAIFHHGGTGAEFLFFSSSFMELGGFCHCPLSAVACRLVWVCPELARWVDWWSIELTAAAGGWWFGLWDNFMYDKVGHKHVLSLFLLGAFVGFGLRQR